MAFKPTREQHYYLIAKHSGKALSVPNGNNGNQITQQVFNPEDGNQKFVFHRGHYFFWIVFPAYGKYVAVHASSGNDGVPIIEWQWEPNAPNLTFEFVPAEDGWYRVMARHSRKFMDIHGISMDAGAGLVQHALTGGANQLFKPIPVANQKVGANATSLSQENELIRTATLGLIGLIPEVGGGLKFIVGLFWKEKNRFEELWDQMKTYVDVRVRQLMNEQKLTGLSNKLKGYLELISQIEASHEAIKGARVQGVLDNIVVVQRDFWPDNDTLEVLPYMVGLGTIIITLRRMMYVDYQKLYGVAPTAEVKEDNKQLLKQAISSYNEKVEKSREALIKWRIAQVPNTGYMSNLINNDVVNYEMANSDLLTGTPPDPTVFSYGASARDNYDGWVQEWRYEETYYGSSVSRKGDSDYKERANFATEQRRNQVKEQFTAEVDELLKPSKLWKFYDPEEAKTPDVMVQRSVGAFGGPYAHKKFEGVSGKRITKVMFYATANGDICGLEVFYDGTSNGLQGRKGNEERTLELPDGEYINSVYGFARYNIQGLWFTTNKGHVEGGGTINGRDGNNLFYADLPDSFNPRLVRISGAHNDNSLEQLTFHWEYLDKLLTV